MGKYAAQSDKVLSTDNSSNLECALAEAAYLTGLERNADVVCMTSYAPLFGHVDALQWRPNLIWVDNLQICGTPSYYVRQLFSPSELRLDRHFHLAGFDVGGGGHPLLVPRRDDCAVSP